MKSRIDEYFEELKNNTEEVMSAAGVIKELKRPLIPSIEQIAAFLGMDRQTLCVYEREEGYEDFHDLVRLTKAKILGQKSSGLINGKGSTTGIIFDMVNNHSYKNKSEVETDNKNETKIVISYEGD